LVLRCFRFLLSGCQGRITEKERDAKTPRSVHNYAAETVTRFGVRTVDGSRIRKPLTTAIHARTMIGVAGERTVDELHQARIDLLQAQLAHASSVGNNAAPLLLAAARRLEDVDLALARQTYLDAYTTPLFGSRFNEGVGVTDVAQGARSASRPPDAALTAGDLLLDVFSALVVDYESAVPVFRTAVQKLAGDEITRAEHWRWLWHGTVLALELWDDNSAYAVSQRAIQLARQRGALHELARG
jgi:hypothetical protein